MPDNRHTLRANKTLISLVYWSNWKFSNRVLIPERYPRLWPVSTCLLGLLLCCRLNLIDHNDITLISIAANLKTVKCNKLPAMRHFTVLAWNDWLCLSYSHLLRFFLIICRSYSWAWIASKSSQILIDARLVSINTSCLSWRGGKSASE